MTISPASLPVLAEALYTVGDEIGFNVDADAAFVARHLEAAGFDIVPRLRDRPAVPLPPRLREVLLLAAAGLSNDEIAAQLWLSRDAVQSRLKNLFRLLGVRTRLDAVLTAMARGDLPVAETLARFRPVPADAKAAV